MKKAEFSKLMADNLAYYVEDPSRRSITTDAYGEMLSCNYRGNSKTEGCFVGRLCSEETREKLDIRFLNDGISKIVNDNPERFDITLPKIVVDNVEIMKLFQNLHDIDDNWTISGLSNIGKGSLKTILSLNSRQLFKKDFKKFIK